MIKHFIIFSRDFHVLAIADRLKDDGRDVTFALCEPDHDLPKGKEEARHELYDGIIEKHDAKDVLKWMAGIENKDDYFCLFDYGDLFEHSEEALEMGFKVGIFPTEEGYKLEGDREYGKQFAKEHYPQLKVAEVHEFKKIDEAIKFLEEQEDKIFVLKSEGSNAETVVPQTDDIDLGRRQIIGALQAEKADYEKGFTLEELIRNPIEISPVMVFWNGKPLFSVVELENKPLGAGNIGRLTGGCQNLTIATPLDCPLNKIAFPPVVYKMAKENPGVGIFDAGLLFDGKQFCFTEFCFDTETEILTRRGWIRYDDVRVGDVTLSLNPKTEEMEWKPIVSKSVRWYVGPMVELKQPTFDALVTPDHHFWIKVERSPSAKLVRRRAADLRSGNDIPRTGMWIGNNIPEITISEKTSTVPDRIVNKGEWGDGGRYITSKRFVKGHIRHVHHQTTMNMADFCYLLGLWLAEGSFTGYHKGEPRSLSIGQSCTNPKYERIFSRLASMGIGARKSQNGFQINDRRLAAFFWDDLGLRGTHADTKFIPSFFKDLSISYLGEIISGYMIGDGCRHKNQWTCSTVSKRLADDLQEVMHKVGWVANIGLRKSKGTKFSINGRTFTRRNDSFILTSREKKVSFQVKTTNRKLVDYDGIVWDVEVADNHSLFVRRNGKAFFSSNCSQRWGFDGFYTEIAMCGDPNGKSNATRHFDLMAAGQNPLRWKYGASVRLFQTQPGGKPETYAGGCAIDWLDEISDQLFLYCIQKKEVEGVEEAIFVSNPYEKEVGTATGCGNTPEEAIARAYKCAEGVAMTGLYYRPRFDFESHDYFTSIFNRLYFIKNSGLI